MKRKIRFALGVGVLLLAGCSSSVHTIESKDGRTTLTEQRGGKITGTWELKQVMSKEEKNKLRKEGWIYECTVHNLSGPDTFLMKRRVKLATAVRPAFHPMLVTTFGTNTTSDGTWRIGASENILDLTRINGFGDSAAAPVSSWSSTISPGDWKAHAGWFVFVESKSNVWAFDGNRRLVLDVETMKGNTNLGGSIYEGGYPCAVPEAVLSRLPEPMKKKIQLKLSKN